MVGLVALITLPREEEPQISVPMVDIHVRADGLRAEDAVKLVTEPLETIIKSIDGVEHVYSQTRDDSVMVTARFRRRHQSRCRDPAGPREGPRQHGSNSGRNSRAADRRPRH